MLTLKEYRTIKAAQTPAYKTRNNSNSLIGEIAENVEENEVLFYLKRMVRKEVCDEIIYSMRQIELKYFPKSVEVESQLGEQLGKNEIKITLKADNDL